MKNVTKGTRSGFKVISIVFFIACVVFFLALSACSKTEEEAAVETPVAEATEQPADTESAGDTVVQDELPSAATTGGVEAAPEGTAPAAEAPAATSGD